MRPRVPQRSQAHLKNPPENRASKPPAALTAEITMLHSCPCAHPLAGYLVPAQSASRVTARIRGFPALKSETWGTQVHGHDYIVTRSGYQAPEIRQLRLGTGAGENSY